MASRRISHNTYFLHLPPRYTLPISSIRFAERTSIRPFSITFAEPTSIRQSTQHSWIRSYRRICGYHRSQFGSSSEGLQCIKMMARLLENQRSCGYDRSRFGSSYGGLQRIKTTPQLLESRRSYSYNRSSFGNSSEGL
jgi:hypothetical protein